MTPINSQPRTSLAAGTVYTESSGRVADASPPVLPSSGKDVIDDGLLSMESANSLLHAFKTAIMPHFPFVMIAPHVTGEVLRREKPFLFLAILAATSYETWPSRGVWARKGETSNQYTDDSRRRSLI